MIKSLSLSQKYFIAAFIVLIGFAVTTQSNAQDNVNPLDSFTQGAMSAEQIPEMPEPLRSAVKRGAQAKYLGLYGGMHGWVLVKGGKPEFHYVTQDGSAIVMGLLFDRNGSMITGEQVRMMRLRDGASAFALSDMVASSKNDPVAQAQISRLAPELASPEAAQRAPQTQSERFYAAVERANWVRLGDPSSPIIYAFIDPDCVHCQNFLKALQSPYLERGLVQLRVLPVGFEEASLKRAAYLLASPNPQGQLLRYAHGEAEALFVPGDIQTEGVRRNIALMTQNNLSGTPVITYKDRRGTIKLVRGNPENLAMIIDELSTKW
jgi:thiol:disulfide interchange protein DsbG